MNLVASRAVLFVVGALAALTACSSGSTDTTTPARLQEAVTLQPFETKIDLSSPSNAMRIELGIDELDRARYRVLRGDTVVVGDSTLGLETSLGSFSTAQDLATIGSAEVITDTFDLPHGKARHSTVRARTQTVQAGGVEIDLWVADTAVAFRYRLRKPGEAVVIDWERTSFAMPSASRTWLQEHDAPGAFTPAYERRRSREATVEAPGRAEHGFTFPALFEHNGVWTLITESGLGDGAAGSHFSPAVTNGEFLLDVAARGEGNGIGDPRPSATDEWQSPWRVILASDQLGDIVASNHVRHLAPAADGDYSWVSPGRVSWSWWSDHESSKQAEAIEPFIDLASDMGWEYSLVDANWDAFGHERLAELAAYAAGRDVGLFVWYNSGGSNNAVTEAPRDLMADATVRQTELAELAAMGIVGVKVDFFQSDKPATIQLYRDIIADARDAGLMVNFHGSTVPRGWSREFPNMMTMEAVQGAEFYTFFDPTYARFAPWQNTVLPFTRNIVGPMDYTPVVLGDHVRRLTTNSHELALSVVFESPLLHLVDTPEAYLSQPDEVIDLLSSVPTAWDETRLLEGTPGSHVVIARRKGNDWWIGAISAGDDARTVIVDPAVLDPSPDSTLLQVCDDPDWSRLEAETYLDPDSYRITTGEVTGALRLDLVSNGGCLLRLSPSG